MSVSNWLWLVLRRKLQDADKNLIEPMSDEQDALRALYVLDDHDMSSKNDYSESDYLREVSNSYQAFQDYHGINHSESTLLKWVEARRAANWQANCSRYCVS